jgi:hypothetical protein
MQMKTCDRNSKPTAFCVSARNIPLTVSTLEFRNSKPADVDTNVVNMVLMAANKEECTQAAGVHKSTNKDSNKRLKISNNNNNVVYHQINLQKRSVQTALATTTHNNSTRLTERH